jgi:TolB-like protein
VASGVGLLLAVVAAFALRGQFTSNEHPHSAAPAVAVRKSIAVVPFIDLTDGMSHEYFADGVTEEVIDKLSKVPDLRVAAPTSSFYLKGKQIAIADIARTLGVAYVLDGSVRKSGATLRVAARLSRADNGYVVWSETYDRPVGDILMIQDDIASAVTKALRTSLDSG